MVTYGLVATAWRKWILKQGSKTSFLCCQGKGPRVRRGRKSFDVWEEPEKMRLVQKQKSPVRGAFWWGFLRQLPTSALLQSPQESLRPPGRSWHRRFSGSCPDPPNGYPNRRLSTRPPQRPPRQPPQRLPALLRPPQRPSASLPASAPANFAPRSAPTGPPRRQSPGKGRPRPAGGAGRLSAPRGHSAEAQAPRLRGAASLHVVNAGGGAIPQRRAAGIALFSGCLLACTGQEKRGGNIFGPV